MMGAIRVWTSGSPSAHLTGQRIYLRAPTDRDWRGWAELRATSRTFLEPWEPIWPHDALSRENYRRRLRQITQEWREGSAYSFHILRQGDNALLGGITLSNVRRGVAQCGTLGYWIGRPHARNGFMAEALHAIVGFSFGQMGLHRLEAACLPNNAASRGLLLKTGFTEEGYARKYLRIHGSWQDHLLFGMVQDDPRPKL